MAARDQAIVTCVIDGWTELTAGDVTNITFQPYDELFIRGTVGAVSPASGVNGGVHYAKWQGEGQRPLTDMFAGAGINRIYGRPVGQSPVKVLVDHG